jgi:hypothetical protein
MGMFGPRDAVDKIVEVLRFKGAAGFVVHSIRVVIQVS